MKWIPIITSILAVALYVININPIWLMVYIFIFVLAPIKLWSQSHKTKHPETHQTTNNDMKSKDDINIKKSIGDKGEEEVAQKLDKIKHETIILRNLILGEGNKTTEIDTLVISEHGIYVIEVKNYSALIYGEFFDQHWTAQYQDGQKHSLYNPIKQNEAHIRALEYTLQDILGYNESDAFRSVVVFSDNAQLKKVPTSNYETMVINVRDVASAIDESIRYFKRKKSTIHLSPKMIKRIYKTLLPFANKNESEKANHVRNVKYRQRYGSNSKYRRHSYGYGYNKRRRAKKPVSVVGLFLVIALCLYAWIFINEKLSSLPF